MIQSHWVAQEFGYDGSQLKPLYGYMNFGVLGDSVIGWRGPCDIPPEHIVDGEDLRAKAEIRGGDMLHFILELFDTNLMAAVAVQRLLVSVAKEITLSLAPVAAEGLTRRGDDLYLREKKFNISIASCSGISSMIHIGFNVSTIGTPVKTLGLEELGIEPVTFAKEFMQQAVGELEGIWRARRKVRPL